MRLICYLSMGYPDLRRSVEIAKEYVDSGCDTIEVDFPAHDPYQESGLIASRMKAALENTADYEDYMETTEAIRQNHPGVSIIILIYEETIRMIGESRFAAFCKKNRTYDVIYIGERYPDMRTRLIEAGIRISSFVPATLDREALTTARHTNGFVYMQAKAQEKAHPDFLTLKDRITHLREAEGIKRPIYAGVGIRNGEDVKMAKEAGADGVFVGSTVLKLHDDIPKLRETIKSLKANT